MRLQSSDAGVAEQSAPQQPGYPVNVPPCLAGPCRASGVLSPHPITREGLVVGLACDECDVNAGGTAIGLR